MWRKRKRGGQEETTAKKKKKKKTTLCHRMFACTMHALGTQTQKERLQGSLCCIARDYTAAFPVVPAVVMMLMLLPFTFARILPYIVLSFAYPSVHTSSVRPTPSICLCCGFCPNFGPALSSRQVHSTPTAGKDSFLPPAHPSVLLLSLPVPLLSFSRLLLLLQDRPKATPKGQVRK